MKPKTKKSAPLFTIHQERDRNSCYAHLEITVNHPSSNVSGYRDTITFRWQTDDSSRDASWYGLRCKVETDDWQHVERLTLAAKTAARLMPDDSRIPSPSEMIDRLVAMGIVRGQYDPRTSLLTPLTAIMPGDVNAYYDSADSSGCMYKVMASDEASAKEMITKKYGEGIADGHWQAESKFSAWVAAGKPVRTSQYDSAPVIIYTETLLKSPFPPVADESESPAETAAA
jgi:hypothetical protein